MYRGEYAPSHPSFAPDSTAACVSVTQNASPDQVQSLSYSSADDAAIESWVRKTVGTAYHSMSTCPMRPKESDGVVDGHLNVYGVQGLKVAGEYDTREANGVALTAQISRSAHPISERIRPRWRLSSARRRPRSS
jgi:choline dehydrogenase-like flavoprotein